MAATTTDPPSDTIKRLLPWLVAVAFFMQSLDTTILNTAVPAIARAMDVMPLSVKAVLASYTLSLAVFIPISGWMADRFGARRVFMSAILLFTASTKTISVTMFDLRESNDWGPIAVLSITMLAITFLLVTAITLFTDRRVT